MIPTEVTLLFEQFKKTVESLTGDALLDKWISFENSAENSQPDLGVLKSQCLEILLIKNFGYGWRGFILQRRSDAAIAQRPLKAKSANRSDEK